jgi:hypothetical protein
MINLPSTTQPIINETNLVNPEWNTFFQQVKTTIKTDLTVDIGVPSVNETLTKDTGEINPTWYSFFEKSYKATGATFGIPSSQEKLGKNWNEFFRNLYQELN